MNSIPRSSLSFGISNGIIIIILEMYAIRKTENWRCTEFTSFLKFSLYFFVSLLSIIITKVYIEVSDMKRAWWQKKNIGGLSYPLNLIATKYTSKARNKTRYTTAKNYPIRLSFYISYWSIYLSRSFRDRVSQCIVNIKVISTQIIKVSAVVPV